MEFDKSKILTVATAEHFKDGQLGWANDRVNWLEAEVLNSEPYVVRESTDLVYRGDFPFISCDYTHRRYFYPAPEPTYRPFKNDEEFKPYRDKWLRHGGVIFQHDGYYDCGILIGNERFSWKEMFKSFVFEDGIPFGKKE